MKNFLFGVCMDIVSFSPFGYEGALVTVEVDLRRGIPAIDLVGLADSAVKEARERMRVAIKNSGFEFPAERVLISLSPADLRKEGSGFDLAIALAVLQVKLSTEKFCYYKDAKILVMGELELSGRVRPVRGIHAAVATAVENDVRLCIVPKENEEEASGLGFIEVCGVETLAEAFNLLNQIEINKNSQEQKIENTIKNNFDTVEFPPIEAGTDMVEVNGQEFLVRGLQIAAAGFHNLIAYGPPGCGKSLALQRFTSLIPYLSYDETLPVTRIYSLAGLMPPNESLLRIAPFRIPHQSASLQGMIGGGINCLPGEVSLAHNGVLFLDEAAEFRQSVLQSLRVPLENGKVTLSRAGRHTIYPAQFQLLIASNPCPCGNYGAEDKICVCNAHSVEQYWKKFSAPLLDRIDIRVPVSSAQTSSEKPKTSAELRVEIARAVETQRSRQGKRNALLFPEEIQYYCKLTDDCNEYLTAESRRYGFSSRAMHSCIKIARTIADMDGAFSIRRQDLEEAIMYRKNEGGVDILF